MSNATYAKLTAGLLVAWFVFSLSAAALHVFQAPPDRPPLPLLLTALTPIALFLLWYATSPGFRRFALSLDAQILTIIQTWRIGGFTFVVLYTFSILPGIFALPAGWGDIAIGATAPFVALKLAQPTHRKGFLLWQVLGIADLVMAVSLGSLARFISPRSVATSAMTVLPLSIVPTFLVPLLLIFHLICIAQARQWSTQPHARVGGRFASSAA
jgi:hypothetical protein